MPENTNTSPAHVHYTLLWNDSPLANEAGKGEGGCLKLIGNKEAFDWQEGLRSPGLEVAEIILQIMVLIKVTVYIFVNMFNKKKN